MKVTPAAIQIDLEDGRVIVVHDTFIQLYSSKWNDKGNVSSTNIQLDRLFACIEKED